MTGVTSVLLARPSAAPISPSRRPFATPSHPTSLRSRASPSLKRRCRRARRSAPWGVHAIPLPPHPPRPDRSSTRSLGGCSKPPDSPHPTVTPRCSSSLRTDAEASMMSSCWPSRTLCPPRSPQCSGSRSSAPLGCDRICTRDAPRDPARRRSMYRSAWQLRADGEVIRGIRGNQRSSEVIEGHMCGSREPMVSPRTLHTRSVPMYIVLAEAGDIRRGLPSGSRRVLAHVLRWRFGVFSCARESSRRSDCEKAKKKHPQRYMKKSLR